MKVNGQGPKYANIVIVGEAPGAEEEMVGLPFVGASGRLLSQLLFKAGINRAECYITNVMKERPLDNNFKTFSTEQLKESYQTLEKEILAIKPNITILLGGEALKALTPYKKISDWRGSIIFVPEIGKVLPTYHPAAALREHLFTYIIGYDLQKAERESHNFVYDRSLRSVEVLRTVEQVLAYQPIPEKPLSFDIETYGKSFTSIGFAQSSTQAFVIPLGGTKWLPIEEVVVWKHIAEILQDPEIPKIGQNIVFDASVLKELLGIEVKNIVFDTMLAFHLLYPEMPKALDFLTSLYTDQPYYKDMISEDLYTYNGLDAMVTFECYEKIKEELIEANQLEFYNKYVNSLIPVVIDMQLKGVKINVELMKKASVELTEETLSLQKRLNEVVGHELNVSSPKQMKAFLFEELKLPPKINRKTKNLSANEEVLKELAQKNPSPIFDLILKIRENQKLVSTYLKAEVEDGRIRCSYNIAGTESGRFSSSKSIWGSGTNLQNVPEGIARKIFIPNEGNIFVSFDLSQAEARVVAYLADCKVLIELFEKGGDIHSENANRLFGQVNKELRFTAKTLIHAANYGIGPISFGKIANISTSEARKALSLFFELYPEIRRWHSFIKDEIKRTRSLTTPLGRRRMFFGFYGDQLFRDAFSYIPQSTVADILNQGLKKTFESGYSVCLQCHDSFLVQVLPIQVTETIREIKELMNIPIFINRRWCRIPVSIKVGLNWNDLKEV